MASQSLPPSLERMLQRRPSFDRPPIRGVNSPRLSAEEADQLTSPFLNYSTGYTYANSQAYNPDKPPAWEVPNMINNNLQIISPDRDYYHYSAPSISRTVFQTITKPFFVIIYVLAWLFGNLLVRPIRALGLLLYDSFDLARHMSQHLGDSFYVTEYSGRTRSIYRQQYDNASTRNIMSVWISSFLCLLSRLVRAPIKMISDAFRSFGLALNRSYYSILTRKGRKIAAEVATKQLYGKNNLSRYSPRDRDNREEEEEFDSDFVEGEMEDEPRPYNYRSFESRRSYNLRSRVITADTDSEDDYPRQQKSVRFDDSSYNMKRSNGYPYKTSKTYTIATWLGSIASSFVYILQPLVYLITASVQKPYALIQRMFSSGNPTYRGIHSSSSRFEKKYSLRNSTRSQARTQYDSANDDYPSATSITSPYFSKVDSLSSSVLFAPIRALLFVAFAAADLLRWLSSRMCDGMVWLWDACRTGLEATLNRRSRWIWWTLPLVLLLLVLLSRRGTDDPLIIFGHDVAKLQEHVSNYAYSIVDSDAVYAKSLNSIYDEYWRTGKDARYGPMSRLASAASNACHSVAVVSKSVLDLIALYLRDVTFKVIDFFATTDHGSYAKIPQLNLWKTSVAEILNATENNLSNGFHSLADVTANVFQGIERLSHLVWSSIVGFFLMIGNAFKNPHVAVLDQQPHEVRLEPQTLSKKQEELEPKVVYVPAPTPKIDEAQLIEKITAIVRAKMDQDLKEKLEAELKRLTTAYDQKISHLKLEKNRVEVDYSHLESLIRAAIYEYDSDKTGMFDFALESAGASIISTRCSENYNTYSRLEKIWNIPLWYSSYGPRTVIQRNSKTLFPGECWSFKGPVGYITIGLSHPINVTIISYEHIGAHQAPGGERPSAPRTFKIWAYKSEADLSTRVLLGDFMYDIKGSPLQFFVVKTQPDYPVKIIEMEVTSNYGAPYTSLYRLRVHGQLYKPGE